MYPYLTVNTWDNKWEVPGAQAYLASTTYNLTELKGINYINYNMPSGDHVSTGIYSRETFENYR